MNEFERHSEAAWVDEHLETYVDGDLSPADRRRIEAFVEQSPEMARQLQLARRVLEELAAVDRPACPPSVTNSVLEAARADVVKPARAANRPPQLRRKNRRAGVRRGRTRSVWTAVLRPAVLTGIFILLVVSSAIFWGRPQLESPTASEPTSAQVEQALRETKWALSFVSDVGRRTGQSIRREVLEERVTVPVQRAVDAALAASSNS